MMIKNAIQFDFKKASLAVAMSLALSACGGSDNDEPPVVNPPVAEPVNYTLAGDDTSRVSIGQSIGLVAAATTNNNIENPHYSWEVTSGDASAVKLSANHQPATSVKIDKAGEYVITLYIKNKASDSNANAIETIDKKVTVLPSTNSTASLSVDRAGISGGSVNFYFDTDKPFTNKDDWTLTQVSGATVEKITKDDYEPYAQIVLPTVTSDEVLAFEAVYKADPSIKDTAYILVRPNACDEGSNSKNANCLYNRPLNHLYAYQPTSVYSDRLVECSMSTTKIEYEEYCTIGELPPIGLDPDIPEVPSIEDIMSRVVVTHDWMGANFERFLREKDPHGDFRRLLRSTTAVVISEDINPSYYWGITGVMHIEAEVLWMTPEERYTVSSTVDSRSGNGSQFDFSFAKAYEKDGKNIFNSDYFPYRDTGRSFESITPYLTSLLYHELSHANDVLRYDRIEGLRPYFNQIKDMHVWDAYTDYSISEELETTYPLTSEILFNFEDILQTGREPTASELKYTGLQVSNEFFADGANDDYNYDDGEDVSMLFEETMMLLRNNTNRYVMVFDESGNQEKIIRGQKNRVTADNVSMRAQFVAERILPNIKNELNSKLTAMNPTELCPGASWYEKFETNCNQINPYSLSYSADRYSIDSRYRAEYERFVNRPKHVMPKFDSSLAPSQQ